MWLRQVEVRWNKANQAKELGRLGKLGWES